VAKRSAGIVGIGETEIGKFPGRTAVDLQAEAVVRAVADAGLGKADIDGLFVLSPYSQPTILFGLAVAEELGLDLAAVAAIDTGGTATCLNMLVAALRTVESGDCDAVVCVFGENAASVQREGTHGWTSQESVECEAPFGVVGAVVPYALLASMYMAQTGMTEADLGAIAIAIRRHASRRPNARRRDPLALDEYLQSHFVAEPLRLLDCSTIVDGAAAFVVARADAVRTASHPSVSLLGHAFYASHRNVSQFVSFERLRLRELANTAMRQAHVHLADVDLLLLHDGFTASVAIWLEGIGFCPYGAAGDYVRSGGIDLGGACPVNTHGGLLSQGHVGGMSNLVEAVRQLRHDAGDAQVVGADTVMIAGGGGIMGVNGVAVLGGVQ
jgi:acetyl-CoA acetyltransferase